MAESILKKGNVRRTPTRERMRVKTHPAVDVKSYNKEQDIGGALFDWREFRPLDQKIETAIREYLSPQRMAHLSTWGPGKSGGRKSTNIKTQ